MMVLEKLKQLHEEILKAELAAWLHDWKKCSDEHIKTILYSLYRNNQSDFTVYCPHFIPSQAQGLPNKDFSKRFFINVATLVVDLCGTFKTISDIVQQGRRGREDTTLPFLIWLLRKCHHAAHIEKEKEDEEIEGIQCTYTPFISSPFGFESHPVNGLTSQMKLEGQNIRSRADIFKTQFFHKAPGDTRRPINEVTLWDWSSIVVALYKAEIARCVLTDNQREPKDIQWRLLSVRTDGLGYLLSANTIPDILARKELLTDAFNGVQKLLEEEYPIGLEVYRDENGSVFVVPDLENLLGLTDSDHNHKTLREFILEIFQRGTVKKNPCLDIQGEIVPKIYPDPEPWDGQTKLPPIGEHLKETPTLQADPSWVQRQWKGNKDEICSVCGLRPIGPSDKAKSRRVCDVCEERREDRAYEWALGAQLCEWERRKRNLPETIWIDEVSDENGRIALIVGKFDLTHWLDGTLVRTLAVREPNDNNGHTADKVAKNPSFARLRRIWETTKRFWEEVEEEIRAVTRRNQRYYFEASKVPSLGKYHAYEIHIGKVKIPVLWDTENKRFWIIDNPDYLSSVSQLGVDFENVVKGLENEEKPLYEPVHYGGKTKQIGNVKITKIGIVFHSYSAYIPILVEPQTFMVIVPANMAMDIVNKIKTKYEREMGKVRNRIPIHVGVVFAQRMTPLRAILDAGRKMLKQRAMPARWTVVCVAHKQINKGDKLPERFSKKNGHFYEWYEVILRADERRITWYVPALMGDGMTEDKWYPYVFLCTNEEPTDRVRYYETDLHNPWLSHHKWLVHVSDLKVGDEIYFTPATFDFIFLDSASRRFDIAYDSNGRRLDQNMWTRPYLLDELDIIQEIWEIMKRYELSERQMHWMVQEVETKRNEWFQNNLKDSLKDDTFLKMCQAVVNNLEWKKALPETIKKRFVNWLVQGYVRDAVELWHHIMKMKIHEKKEKSNA